MFKNFFFTNYRRVFHMHTYLLPSFFLVIEITRTLPYAQSNIFRLKTGVVDR